MLSKDIKNVIVSIINENFIKLSNNMLLFVLDAVEDFSKSYKSMRVMQKEQNKIIMLDEGVGNIAVMLDDSSFNIVMFNANKAITVAYYMKNDSLGVVIKSNKATEDYVVFDVTNHSSTIKIISEKVLTSVTASISNLINVLYSYESGLQYYDVEKKKEHVTKITYKSNTMGTYEELKEKVSLMKQTSLKTAIFYTDDNNKLHILN